jgi:hypothetical protein
MVRVRRAAVSPRTRTNRDPPTVFKRPIIAVNYDIGLISQRPQIQFLYDYSSVAIAHSQVSYVFIRLLYVPPFIQGGGAITRIHAILFSQGLDTRSQSIFQHRILLVEKEF